MGWIGLITHINGTTISATIQLLQVADAQRTTFCKIAMDGR